MCCEENIGDGMKGGGAASIILRVALFSWRLNLIEKGAIREMRGTIKRKFDVRTIILPVEREMSAQAARGRAAVSIPRLTLRRYFLINAALLFGVAHLLQTPRRVMMMGRNWATCGPQVLLSTS